MTATADGPIERIPDPDTLRQELAASIRRSDLLRGLIRVARRKAAYNQPAPAVDAAEPAPAGKAAGRG